MTNDVLAAFNAEIMRLTTQYQQHNGEPNVVELFCTDLCFHRDRYRQKLALMVLAGDMTRAGRPGGNITGVAVHYDDVLTKHLEMASELVPGLARVGFINDAADAGASH